MAYTQADLDALQEAIATGAMTVKFGSGPDSREVTYRSLADMRAIEANIIAAITPAARQPIRTSFVSHSRD
jgi:hypothetical protein